MFLRMIMNLGFPKPGTKMISAIPASIADLVPNKVTRLAAQCKQSRLVCGERRMDDILENSGGATCDRRNP
jgi:hypothetical protein